MLYDFLKRAIFIALRTYEKWIHSEPHSRFNTLSSGITEHTSSNRGTKTCVRQAVAGLYSWPACKFKSRKYARVFITDNGQEHCRCSSRSKLAFRHWIIVEFLHTYIYLITLRGHSDFDNALGIQENGKLGLMQSVAARVAWCLVHFYSDPVYSDPSHIPKGPLAEWMAYKTRNRLPRYP